MSNIYGSYRRRKVKIMKNKIAMMNFVNISNFNGFVFVENRL